MLAERPVPVVAIAATRACGGVTKWVQHNELCITPLELVIILWQTNFPLGLIIAREEIIRNGVRQIAFSCRRCPKIRSPVTGFAIVVAQSEIQGSRMAEMPQVISLSQVLRLR